MSGLLDGWTEAQRRALRKIVDEWIADGFEVPPYSEEQYDIFEALDLAEDGVYDTRRPEAANA